MKEAILPVLAKQESRRRDDEKAHRLALIQWATRFRDDRVARIRNGEGTAAALSSKHLVCVHAVPHGAISNEIRIDVGNIETFPAPIGSTGYNSPPDFNADGLIRESREGSAMNGYLQLFRSGIVESVDSHMMVARARGHENSLSSPFFAMSVSGFLTHTVGMWRALNIAPPACVLLTLCGLNGVPFSLPAHEGYFTRPFAEETIYLPEVVIADFDADPKPRMRHSLDVLWQAAGESGCPYFNSDGDWIGRF